jgi:hypothetical protein
MTRTWLAVVLALGWMAYAKADGSGDQPWPPIVAPVELAPVVLPGQVTQPAPSVLAPTNPTWGKPGDAESLTTTGRPAPKEGGGEAGGGEGEAGADNGTNPAQNTRTAIVRNEWNRLDGGNRINTTYVSFKFPCLDRRGALIIEVPFNHYNLVEPVRGQIGGLGDLKAQLNYNAWVSDDKRATFLTMLEMFIPSADNFLLGRIGNPNNFVAQSIGTGKYVLGPGAGFVYAIEKNFIAAPLYFYESSVAGAETQPRISRGKLRFFLMYAWPDGLYVLPEFQVVTDFLSWNNDVYAGWEVGYSTKGTTFYVKPGLGFRPNPGDREWGVEFGVRVQF